MTTSLDNNNDKLSLVGIESIKQNELISSVYNNEPDTKIYNEDFKDHSTESRV